MIVQRNEFDKVKKASSRLLIYGRRKVGKTFLVRNSLEHDILVFVKRGGGFLIEGATPSSMDSYDEFISIFRIWIESGKRIVIDEFQRMPDDFLDILHFLGDRANLTLTGSSFHVVKNVLSPSSPILGLFSEMKMGLISPSDIFRSLSSREDPISAFSLSPYLRDPWTMQFYRDGQTDIVDILQLSKATLRSLIGEVFLEEEKGLSATYEGILRSLSLGKWKLGQISDLLYSRKVLKKPDPHLVRPYFNIMEEMDLVDRVPIYRKKENLYRIRSPIMELGYRIDERMNFFNQDIQNEKLRPEVDGALPKHIEQFAGEFFGEIFGGQFNYFYSKEFDIDFVITRGKKTLAVGEVKWVDRPRNADVLNFIDRTKHFKCDRIFFSKKPIKQKGLISVTPDNILDLEV